LISAKLGHFLDRPLSIIAKRITLSPNTVTFIGFFITGIAALSIPFDLLLGGLLMVLGGLFDALDGVIARVNNRGTKFGAFLDSTLDRYSDSFIFLAIAWYFFRAGNNAGVIFSLGSLVGALLISYARARAEGLGIACSVGLMERPERVVLLAFGCITGWLYPVVVSLFFFSHFTVLQRMVHVYRGAK